MPLIYDLAKPIQWSALEKPVYADTNVISPIFYDRSGSVPNQTRMQALQPYQSAISDMFSNGVQLHVPSIVLMEMCNVFLKWDIKIYNFNKIKGHRIDNPKDFRELASEQLSRKQRYSLIFKQLNTASTIELHDMEIHCSDAVAYTNTADSHSLDTNDYMITQFVSSQNGILLTDDHDFACSITGCDLITINPRLIMEATQAGFSLA